MICFRHSSGQFDTEDLARYMATTQNPLIVGQQHEPLIRHSYPMSLDFWLRSHLACCRPDTAQATVPLLADILNHAPNRFILVRSTNPLTGRLCKAIQLQTPTTSGKSHFFWEIENNKVKCRSKRGKIWFYHEDSLSALIAHLNANPGWNQVGSVDEQTPALAGTVEHWARNHAAGTNGTQQANASENAPPPHLSWWGLTPHYRGRFGSFIPAILLEQKRIDSRQNSRRTEVRV
jgi:hypothetical protein